MDYHNMDSTKYWTLNEKNETLVYEILSKLKQKFIFLTYLEILNFLYYDSIRWSFINNNLLLFVCHWWTKTKGSLPKFAKTRKKTLRLGCWWDRTQIFSVSFQQPTYRQKHQRRKKRLSSPTQPRSFSTTMQILIDSLPCWGRKRMSPKSKQL